eukprot:5234849-Lingulodinium_polyedra.AAC.1
MVIVAGSAFSPGFLLYAVRRADAYQYMVPSIVSVLVGVRGVLAILGRSGFAALSCSSSSLS